jgi:hypothetical protein
MHVKIPDFMKLPLKYAFLFIICLLSIFTHAQQAAIPSKLSASYKKYHNRIELTWQATATDHRYIVQRRERAKKAFTPIDTVAQNRYVDRNKLRVNTDYFYCIQSVEATGAVSLPSEEAMGALLGVAEGKDARKDSLSLENCIHINITEAKASAKFFALKFLAQPACPAPKTAQLTLYRSDDAILDDSDRFLLRQAFNFSRTRGALTAKNTGETTRGYLILKVESNGDGFVVSGKIE